jgi:hypothetical protein
MSRPAEKQARAEAMLGELAELSLMVAKELAVRLRETEDVDQTVALAGAFQKVSRVVRLTLALDVKLDRDAARDARETRKAEAESQAQAVGGAPAPAPRSRPPVNRPVRRREDPLHDRLDRLLWSESEGDAEEFERLWEEFDERVDAATANPEFKDMSIEAIIERVIADMGLTDAEANQDAGADEAPPEPALTDTG